MGMITLTLYLNPIPSFTTMSSELLKQILYEILWLCLENC